jgi:thiazole synthase
MSDLTDKPLEFYGHAFASRMLIGTARYPSPEILSQAVKAAGSEIVTVSLRRESAQGRGGQKFWELIKQLDVTVLPNTAGCHTVKDAVTTAHMAREVFDTDWIKLEVIGDDDTLQPDVIGLVEAARILNDDGFKVFPYTTEDLIVADRLAEAGCRVIMPWGAPIGTGQGLVNPAGLKALRARFPELPVVVDAGIGAPSHAARSMEIGYDAVLLNTAIANAVDPVMMAKAFARALEAGRTAYLAGLMEKRDMAQPSTPTLGRPFWHADKSDTAT